jgi:hypothetical protein
VGLFAAFALLVACAAFALLVACVPAQDSDPAQDEGQTAGDHGATAETHDPEALFASLEERLVSAEEVRVNFQVTAEGVIEANLLGMIQISAGGVTDVRAKGVFAGEQADLYLRSEGGQYEFGNLPDLTSGPTPEYLDEGLLVGFTRMGILHNLAMLAGNALPDGVDGGVRDWAVVESFAFDDAEVSEAASRVVSFSMVVGGAPAGSVTLEIGAGGHPMLRRQTVQFPTGEMRVVETYSAVSIDP